MPARRLAAAAIAALTLAPPALAAPPSPQAEHGRWKADHAQWSSDAARAREAARRLEALAAETDRMVAEHEAAMARHQVPPAPAAVDAAAPDQGGATRAAAPAPVEDHATARASHEAQRRRHARLMDAVQRVEKLPVAR